MINKRSVELYRRLPEIYRIKDGDLPTLYLTNGEPAAANQLRSYLEPVEDMFSAIHENIESLYHDLFIETCDEWVIPYIGDLLGTGQLSGEEWTLRADVADTIALRRRKGTLGAVELLAFILTKWGVHCVELLENMVWNQHLNHQRPDEGGDPPYSFLSVPRGAPIRGGTINLRDPSLLAQLNTPFDPFAHVADVRPHETGQVRYNLPNLAIYLWRLEAYRIKTIKPGVFIVTTDPDVLTSAPEAASRVARVNINPIQLDTTKGRPVNLFNTNRFDLFSNSREGTDALNLSAIAPRVSSADHVPGPMPVQRISDYDIAEKYDESLASSTPQPLEFFTDASFTAPQEYLAVESYDEIGTDLDDIDITDVGLQLHLPSKRFGGEIWPHKTKGRHWTIRGADLSRWEHCLNPPLADREIAIDPDRGRICIGVSDDDRAKSLGDDLLVTFTYGAPGPVGAHPISYGALPKKFDRNQTPTVIFKKVNFLQKADGLQDALAGIALQTEPTVIEITDSMTHRLDLSKLPPADVVNEKGILSIKLGAPLIIRAADGQRPVIELGDPLAFRPVQVYDADGTKQAKLDAQIENLFVRLEGLYIVRAAGYGAQLPLIARAALGKIELIHCTLDPLGSQKKIVKKIDKKTDPKPRAPLPSTLLSGIKLENGYGFDDANEERTFKQTPEIIMQFSISGAILTDEGYRLCISDSIVASIPLTVSPEGHKPRRDVPFAITGATDPATGYAGATTIQNVTILGRVRVASIEGSGGIFKEILEAFDQQLGCLKFCYFADDTLDHRAYGVNRLPTNFGCIFGIDAKLIFTSEIFGEPGYCQLSLECDPRILEEGPGVDQMGAFNFLSEAHKWRNLRIRFREFMPVGIRPLLIPVT
ncbi:MAG TPA: hypothetical protein VGO50_02835 [Pyrinomonadaceae bacterium]|nr:hypothetical protein [Pyrinomonadaceae bacterium]